MGLGPTPGGNSSLLNVTAAAVVKSSAGTLFTVAQVIAGTGGTLTFNDVQALAYNAATAYVIGNACTSSGVIYYCILASTGNAPPNATYWSTTAPTASKVLSIAYGSIGTTPTPVNWNFQNGIVVSSVPTGGVQLSLAYS